MIYQQVYYYNYLISFMFHEQQQNNQPRNTRSPFLIMLILCLVIIIPLQSVFQANKSDHQRQKAMNQLVNPQQQIRVAQNVTLRYLENLMLVLDNKQYIGTWQKVDEQQSSKEMKNNSIISSNSGKFKLRIHKHISNSTMKYYFYMKVFNKNYIDDGYSQLSLAVMQIQAKEIILKNNYTYLSNESFLVPIIAIAQTQKIFQINITHANIQMFAQDVNDQIHLKIYLNSLNFTIATNQLNPNSIMINNIIVSILLTITSNVQLFAAIQILKKILLGEESAERYSLVTFLFFTIWDCVIMFITFSLSLEVDNLLIIYIAPMFFFTILFTSLEMKILLMIFNSENNQSQANQIQFQIFVYACLLLTYPLLNYLNYSHIFFALLPFIGIPQIYKTALRGQRIKIQSNYLKLYLPRFIFLFYLRGYPSNLFDLRPNYLLCSIILLFLGLILGYNYLQFLYGSRIFIPRFLLPKKYDYLMQEKQLMTQMDDGIQNIQDCAVCISPLHIQPIIDDIRMNNELGGQYIGKIMKTPCKHNYHGYCLIKWMQHKMECPTCRAKLPPIQ